MDPNIVDLNGGKYIKERFLGKGGFGQVDMVRKVYCIIPTLQGRPSIYTTGPAYALKTIDTNASLSFQKAMDEVNILKSSCHPHIIRLFDAVAQPSSVLILMEYCEGGNLNSRLARPSDRETNLRWMKELANAMYYLHSKNIAHRDLKPENVLLTGNGSIKLGDFGLAREFAIASLKQGGAMLPDEALVFYLRAVYMGTVAGSKPWMAPEVFDGHYTEKADIFSLGTILYAILTRACISDGGKTYYGAFVSIGGQTIGLGMAMRSNPNVMVPLDGLPRSTRELLHKMLAYDPRNRPSAREVLGKIGSILYLDDSSSPNPQSIYPTVNIQLYPHNPFPQPAPSPIPNFFPPSPSPSEQSTLPNTPYLQAGPPFPYYSHPQVPPPPPVVAPPSSNLLNPQPMHGRIFPMDTAGHAPVNPTPTFIRAHGQHLLQYA